MLEGDFEQFEENRACPSDIPVSHNHHLAPPAEQVSHEVHVEDSFRDVCILARWVFGSVDPAVISVASLGHSLSQVSVEVAEYLPCLFNWEHEKVCHEERVDEEQGQADSPKDRVRSTNDRVWHVNGAEGYEGNYHSNNGTSVFHGSNRVLVAAERFSRGVRCRCGHIGEVRQDVGVCEGVQEEKK